MRYAVLFPGQGSQHVGMGDDLFPARPDLLGAAADEILGWSLADICREGPEAELRRTDRAQPALYAIGYALWESWREAAPRPPVAAAGHSLGEYTALAAAGALSYRDGLRLVAARGRAMATATVRIPGAMAAVVGVDLAVLEDVVAARRQQGGRLWVANVNAPGQIVVAGAESDVAWLASSARDLGLRRVIALNVAGAFHTPLMQPAADELAASLAGTAFTATRFPVWSNLEAAPIDDARAALEGQLTGKVRFSESLLAMRDAGVEAFVHLGPGDVTAGLAKRTIGDCVAISVSTLSDIPVAVEQLTVL
jgi:[acyl-carrier-protein] S-malonyltransferase